jgi:DEAD/DEAH box helicase
MPEHDAERLAVAAEVRSLLAIEDVLSPAQARSFVRCLQTSWDVQTIQWSGGDSATQLTDAKRLIHAADIFGIVEGWDSDNARQCYRRAGELLEWLARSNDDLRAQDHIELLAAAAFQLGGLPAMASSLLSLADLSDAGAVLYARFLQADFDAVVRQTNRFWRQHPELTDREGPARLLNEDTPEKLSWYITSELVRCVGLIADTLRRGDDSRFAQGLQKLKALDAVVARTFSEETSLLVSLLHSVARTFDAFSIYKPMTELAAGQAPNLLRLRAIARNQFSRGRGVLWASQRQGLKRLATESSFALCTPTGSGKTLVANLALVKELLLRPSEGLAPLALYLVPSRALASEVESKLQSELGRELVITGLYGGTDWGITDYWLTADQPTVLIATVEKADALMRYVGPTLLPRLRLLILDEAHQVVPDDSDNSRVAFADHSSRPARLESFVSRLFALAPSLVRIALTAVAGGSAGPVAR